MKNMKILFEIILMQWLITNNEKYENFVWNNINAMINNKWWKKHEKFHLNIVNVMIDNK